MNRTYGVVAAVLLLVGLGLVGGGVVATLEENERAALPETNGTVLSSELEAVQGEDAHRPNVTYRYAVDGTTYTSDSVFPPTLEGEGSRAWASGVVDEYEPGDRVNVTYDPDAPDESYIRERRSPTPVISFGMGMVALAFAFLFGVAALQSGRDVVQDEPWRIADGDEESGGSRGDASSDDDADSDDR
jgi:hypothetical protein